MRNTALLIIDVQQGAFASAMIPPVHEAEQLLRRIERLLQWARRGNAQVLYVQHCGAAGHPLEKGTVSWKIHPRVAPLKGEPVIQKQQSDLFYKTRLRQELKKRKVKNLIIAGIQSDFCVDTACRRAFSEGFKVTLVKDAHSTWDSKILAAPQIIEHHNSVLGNGFVTLSTTEEITKVKLIP